MKKFVFATIAVIAVFSIALCLDAQPAGGGMGGAGGGMGGFGGAGGGMGMGAGMMGGGRGGARAVRPRPEKAARLAAVAELEKEVAALKAAVEKAPAKDPNLATIKDADLTKFMDAYTVESNEINKIQATLTSMQRTAAGAGMGMARMGAGAPSEEVLTELSDLAKGENATKTAARIAELIQAAQQRGNRGGAGGAGGGAGRGGRGARGGAGA